jgi:hypothetical protein
MVICDFMELLAIARKSFIKIQNIVRTAYGDKAWKRIQMWAMSKGEGGETGSVSGRPETPQHEDFHRG